MSQALLVGRQVSPAARSVQSLPQHDSGVRAAAPASHPSPGSSTPFTRPAELPSAQRSVPVFGSVAAKKSLPPTAVSSCGFELSGPGLMSPTSTVPAAVPLLFQSSRPVVGSKAAKKSVPFTFVRPSGEESPGPGLMSLTSTVPAAVPSLFQSSRPFASAATTKSGASTAVGPSGGEERGPGLMTSTSSAPPPRPPPIPQP